MKMKKYICLIDNLCLLGTADFCNYHIYDHYADEAGQTEAFMDIAESWNRHRQRAARCSKF